MGILYNNANWWVSRDKIGEEGMNKQQLAAKIWKAANEMRSKIEANEYKDYILGFIFYKFLSENEERYFKKMEATEDEIAAMKEDDEYAKTTRNERNLGYFIEYKNLFSTWLKMGNDFSIDNVITALNAFARLNYTSKDNQNDRTKRTIYYNIFETLDKGLSKLGENAQAQTKAVKKLIKIIDDIPINENDEYDVLGFIYEYLISNFAANAGKKAGEFYTPHEVSLLMSELIADHLKDRQEIKIYDPTSGSGSLLINIGSAVSKKIIDRDQIKYYAQELKENTYNLTRMNLIMHGIKPQNIIVRCGDTLGRDWPMIHDESDPDNSYEPLCNLDAVVSNPPYSQKWDPTNKKNQPRFADYGVAPKTKADYAFLLHNLYHLDANGIMTIVLPHGVLFRGGDEAEIRKNLVEKNNIDAIIGLPANIFFGTGIPTIIMVLKKGTLRNDLDDVLIIDASKGFEKEGKSNKLRARDIKKIVDAYIERKEIPNFSRRISRELIRQNDYNLNIPRYVDSSEKSESYDIYATMFGGIPKSEIDNLNKYFEVFTDLRTQLFTESTTPYVEIKAEDVKTTIENNQNVLNFKDCLKQAFEGFEEHLYSELIDKMQSISIASEENIIAEDIFNRLVDISLIDKYEAYQLLDDKWKQISIDLEMIRSEGQAAIIQVDPHMVTKKKGDEEVEVQDGWIGHIIPFDIAQKVYYSEELDYIAQKESELNVIANQYEEFIEQIPEDEKGGDFLNEDNTAFVPKEVVKVVKPYSKGKLMPEAGSVDEILCKVNELIAKEKKIKKDVKDAKNALHNNTKSLIESLSFDEAKKLLKIKWIDPVINSIMLLPNSIVSALISKVSVLTKKYSVSLVDLDDQIGQSSSELVTLLDELEGDEFDMQGIKQLKKMLEGVENE